MHAVAKITLLFVKTVVSRTGVVPLDVERAHRFILDRHTNSINNVNHKHTANIIHISHHICDKGDPSSWATFERKEGRDGDR